MELREQGGGCMKRQNGISEQRMSRLCTNGDVDGLNGDVRNMILEAASEIILKSKGIMKTKLVPWWTEECKIAVESWNKAFR